MGPVNENCASDKAAIYPPPQYNTGIWILHNFQSTYKALNWPQPAF